MSRSDSAGAPEWLPTDPGERVWLRAAPSRNLLLAGFALAFVILISMSVVIGSVGDLRTGRRLSVVLIVLTVGAILFAYFTIVRHEYVLTDRRACVGVGIRSKRIEQIELDRVDDVVIEQPTWQQWVKTGNVRFVGETDRTLRFAFVERPYALYRRILGRVESTS